MTRLLITQPTGSDAANQKSTYVSLLGLEGARAAAESYTAQAVQAAAALGTSGAPLATLAELLFRRKK